MTKRSNPYVEDFVPQSKTHVGLKQFNNNEDRMQKVYEKTLHLLFKGAKKAPEEIKILDTAPSTKTNNCMKQLQINKDGTLGRTLGAVVETDKHSTAQTCVCDSPRVESGCCYCEVPLCSACSTLCARCLLTFCSNCSLHGSEGTEICVSCYG